MEGAGAGDGARLEVGDIAEGPGLGANDNCGESSSPKFLLGPLGLEKRDFIKEAGQILESSSSPDTRNGRPFLLKQ